MLEILKTDVDDLPVKTIIFSQFTSMLDLIEPHLRENNIKFGRCTSPYFAPLIIDDGKMRKDARDAMLNAFRTTPMAVLLVSLKSGSVGLNLTSASRVIMVDMWWNPAIEEQAIDRVHRIGQTRRVVVHKLTIRNSIDERIAKLQEQKREAAKGALGDGVIRRKGMNANKLSLEDVLYLFSMPEGEPDV
jgi:SNF2 family DNA or RNA helicase